MRLNGHAKTATLSIAGSLIAAAIAVSGYYTGWKGHIAAAAIRDQKIDDHLAAAEKGFTRLATVEAEANTNAQGIASLAQGQKTLSDAVAQLVASQKSTNDKLDHLSDQLTEYLVGQARRRQP